MMKPSSEQPTQRRRWLWWLLLALLLLALLFLWRCKSPAPVSPPEQENSALNASNVAPAKRREQQDGQRKSSAPLERSDNQSQSKNETPSLSPGAGKSLEDYQRELIDPAKVQEVLKQQKMLGGKMPVITKEGTSPLETLFPAQLQGLTRTSVTSTRTQYETRQGLLGSARGFYGSADSPALTATLVDGGLGAAAAMSTEFLSGKRQTEDARQTWRQWSEGPRLFSARWMKAERLATARVLLASRLSLEATVENAPSDQAAEQALRAFDWAAIESAVSASPLTTPTGQANVHDISGAIGETLRKNMPAAEASSLTSFDPQSLLVLLPAELSGLPLTKRDSQTQRVRADVVVPVAQAEYQREKSGPKLSVRVEINAPNLGLLAAKDRVWQLTTANAGPHDSYTIERGCRMHISRDRRADRATCRVLLGEKHLLVLTAESHGSAELSAQAAITAAQSLDWDAIVNAAAQSK